MTTPISKDDALNQLSDLLAVHFPDADPAPQSSDWHQDNHCHELFDLCRRSYLHLDSDDVRRFVHGSWNISRQHPFDGDTTKSLEELVVAWKAWHCALSYLHEQSVRQK